jgi:O-Antigen ligase
MTRRSAIETIGRTWPPEAITLPLARNNVASVRRVIYFCGIVAIPFNAVAGPGPLGEMRNELSVVPFAVAMALCLGTDIGKYWASSAFRTMLLVACALAGFCLLSLAVNFTTIINDQFHDRNGLIKFVTTFSVLVYGICLSFCTLVVVRDDDRFLANGVLASAAIALIYCLFEYASQKGVGTGLFKTIDGILHGGFSDTTLPWSGALNLKMTEGWDTRLRSVCFEPPAFGNYCGFAYPWIVYASFQASGRKRIAHFAFLLAFTGLIILSRARTGQLMLVAALALMAVIRILYLTPSRHPLLALGRITLPCLVPVALVCAAIGYADAYPGIVASVVDGDSVSNLSRLASQVAALSMFADHPFFGVGLGQFAYYEAVHLPAWGFLSDELGPSLTYSEAPWPAVYSIFPRIAAECGIFAVVGWTLLWSLLIVAAIRAGRALGRDGRSSLTCYPVAATCLCVLVSGITTDTFRTPMIWIGLAMTLSFLERARRIERSVVPAQSLDENRFDPAAGNDIWPGQRLWIDSDIIAP